MSTEFASVLNIITTEYLTQLVIAVVFPAIAIGVATKFMRNLDRD